MANDALIQTVSRYFKGCNTGDFDLMVSCFCDDIESYFIDISPVVGAENLARFLCEMHKSTGARWTLDRGIAQDDQAVVEWSVLWTPPGEEDEVLERGTDWFVFRDDRIKEIRQYYYARDLKPGQRFEMLGYPYPERGYPTKANLDSRLPR